MVDQVWQDYCHNFRKKSMRVFKIFALSLGLLLGTSGSAQKRTSKLQQFNNFTAQFEVPAGTSWMIQSIYSDFAASVSDNGDGTATFEPVRIFIKTLNGDIKTDWEGNRFGPQVYQSDNTSATIQYPIMLPEETKFSLVIISGKPGAFRRHDGTAYISITEIKND